jgi:hypothetical protein
MRIGQFMIERSLAPGFGGARRPWVTLKTLLR